MCSELGHGDVVCLATRRVPRSRCVRPISASQHSTYEYPYSPAPGSSSSAVTRRACTRWVAPTVTEAPSVSRRSFVRFGGSPEPVGSFRPDRVGLRLPRFCPRTRIWLFSYAICGDRPSDTPVASPTRPAHFSRFLGGARGGESRQIVSPSAAVTQTEDFAIRGAFPRQVLHVSF